MALPNLRQVYQFLRRLRQLAEALEACYDVGVKRVKKAVSAEEMRRADERAAREFKIPVLALMENAGEAVARACLKIIREKKISSPKVLVLCGGGNNAGDGFVAARLLHVKKIPVQAALFKSKETFKDAVLANFIELDRAGVPFRENPRIAVIKKMIQQSSLVVDALVGIGLKSKIQGKMKRAIQILNGSGKCVVAVDIPSGLDADTGDVHGICVRADATVTMAALKNGMLKERALPWLGKVAVADIGLPLD